RPLSHRVPYTTLFRSSGRLPGIPAVPAAPANVPSGSRSHSERSGCQLRDYLLDVAAPSSRTPGVPPHGALPESDPLSSAPDSTRHRHCSLKSRAVARHTDAEPAPDPARPDSIQAGCPGHPIPPSAPPAHRRHRVSVSPVGADSLELSAQAPPAAAA